MYDDTMVIDGMIYKYHHCSYARGYVKVKDTIITPYKGRFGEGYTVDKHCNHSSYYFWRAYFIKEV